MHQNEDDSVSLSASSLGNSGVGTVEVSGVGTATFTNPMNALEARVLELFIKVKLTRYSKVSGQ